MVLMDPFSLLIEHRASPDVIQTTVALDNEKISFLKSTAFQFLGGNLKLFYIVQIQVTVLNIANS